jgi:hypothetical protein
LASQKRVLLDSVPPQPDDEDEEEELEVNEGDVKKIAEQSTMASQAHSLNRAVADVERMRWVLARLPVVVHRCVLNSLHPTARCCCVFAACAGRIVTWRTSSSLLAEDSWVALPLVLPLVLAGALVVQEQQQEQLPVVSLLVAEQVVEQEVLLVVAVFSLQMQRWWALTTLTGTMETACRRTSGYRPRWTCRRRCRRRKVRGAYEA